MFYVVRKLLISIGELVVLGLVVNLLADSINIPPTPTNRIIFALIALCLATILFIFQNIATVRRYIPPKILTGIIALLLATTLLSILSIRFSDTNICALSPNVEQYISTENRTLIQQRTPGEKDREQEIYNNNKKVDTNNPYLLAVAIPANAESEAARAMLAGVADAQTKFNQAQQNPTIPKTSHKQLKVVVVDDKNNEQDFAKKVACQIATNPEWKNILGVIGHHSSGASKAALDIYAKAGITMITPTSTSTNLKQGLGNKVFFRTTVTNEALGSSLAEKINPLGKVRVFYEGDNEYADDLNKQFIQSLGSTQVEQAIDIKDLTSTEIDGLNIPSNVKAAVIFSSSGNGQKHQIAIDLIKKLKSTIPDISLFGGDSLYKGRTLYKGQTDIEGLQLVIPWFRVNLDGQMISDYARESEQTWGGQINWMTASSYDATQAFLAAISQVERTSGKVDRKSVLEFMPKVVLEKKYTSGEKLEFQNGEPKDRKPVFVKVVRDQDKKLQCGFEVCFKPVK